MLTAENHHLKQLLSQKDQELSAVTTKHQVEDDILASKSRGASA